MTSALIVAHGQPSDQVPAEEDLADLAARVAAHLPGWRVGSATLAQPDALAHAAARQTAGVIFPLFMAGGWFTRTAIPARLAQAGITGWRVLEPFGCDPALHDLAVAVARDSGADRVILAAHGSFKSSTPAAIAAHVAARIRHEAGRPAQAAFIDQTPQLDSLQGYGAETVCLPFFARAGDHVTNDIPAALARAGFQGRILSPLGLHGAVPALIARAITGGQTVCAGSCRWVPSPDQTV